MKRIKITLPEVKNKKQVLSIAAICKTVQEGDATMLPSFTNARLKKKLAQAARKPLQVAFYAYPQFFGIIFIKKFGF